MSLKGKVAVVTGSTSGIGLAIARALARDGADVMLNGFGDAAAIETTRAGLAAEFGVRCLHHSADMSKPAEIADLVAAAAARLGGVSILVNNAGIQHTARIEDFPPAKWDAILAINLSAAFHATRAALPLMRRAGWGRIVNTASAHGLVASVEKSAYVAAKHGLVGLTKVTALETAGSGITCNAFCPGFVLTDLIKPQIQARADARGGDWDKGVADLLAEKQPSKRLATPEQLAAYVAFLCSDAAAEITGTALPIDGGWTAQ
jgi:3-hydroxybutyrate dehydrogenase